MPTFPTREWIETVADAVAAHPNAPQQAEKVAGVYRLHITDSGPLEQDYIYTFSLSPGDDGARPRVELVDDVPEDLGISADYERWKQLITGELDPTRALLQRKVAVSGGLTAAMQRIGAVTLLQDAVATVETSWPDEA